MSLRALSGWTLAILLAGCALGPHRDQLHLLSLEPLPARAQAAPAEVRHWQVLIEEPLADPVLADFRVVRRSADGLGVYRGVGWRDAATRLWQGLLVQSFQNDGRLPGVARSSARLHGHALLVTELRAFEVVDDLQVVIHLQAQLIRTDHQQLVAARAFRGTADVPAGAGGAGLAAAFQRAANVVLPDIVDWTLALESDVLLPRLRE